MLAPALAATVLLCAARIHSGSRSNTILNFFGPLEGRLRGCRQVHEGRRWPPRAGLLLLRLLKVLELLHLWSGNSSGRDREGGLCVPACVSRLSPGGRFLFLLR